jgi:lysophospholipase L1-like esterase
MTEMFLEGDRPGALGPRRRGPWRAVLATTIAAAGLAAVPVVELERARRHPKLVERDHVLDGDIGHDGATESLRLVWLGDSTAAGVGAETVQGALPWQVASALGRPISLRVLARSGARVRDVLAEQLPRLAALEEPPDLVLVSVGANDVVHVTRGRVFRQQYTAMLEALTGTRVVVLGIPDMASALVLDQPVRAIVGARARRVDRWIRSIAAPFPDVHHIDISARPRSTRAADYLSADRYHPNEAGYGLWASIVAATLVGLIV